MAAKPDSIIGPGKVCSFAFMLVVFVFAFELTIAGRTSMDNQSYGMNFFQMSCHFVTLCLYVAKKTKGTLTITQGHPA